MSKAKKEGEKQPPKTIEIEKLRCVLYRRVSTDDQAEQYWPELQLDAIKGHINKTDHLEYAEWMENDIDFFDSGVSGTKPYFRRPELSRLFKIYEGAPKDKKPFNAIVVYKLDRLARSLTVLLEIVKKCEDLGIAIISATEMIDTATHFGKAMISIMGVFAELERNMIRDRMKAWRDKAIENGIWQREIYGYRRNKEKKPEIDAEESKVVVQIFERYAHGVSVPDIQKRLKEQQILRPELSLKERLVIQKGKPREQGRKNWKTWPYDWGYPVIKNMLENKNYIGIHHYNKSEYISSGENSKSTQVNEDFWIKSNHPHTPIVSPEIFEKVQKRMRETTTARNTAETPYLLTGLLKCACCRELFLLSTYPSWNGAKTTSGRYYVCSAKQKHKDQSKNKYDHHCPTLSIPADDLEKLVIEHIRRVITDSSAIDKYTKRGDYEKNKREVIVDRITNYAREIWSIQKGIWNIDKMCEDWRIDYESEWKQKIEKHEKKIQGLNQLIEQEKQKLNEADGITSYKKALSLVKDFIGDVNKYLDDKESAKELLGYLVKEIIVYARPRTSQDKLRWRTSSDQYIPHRIRIILNLPQEFLDSMASDLEETVDNLNFTGWVIHPKKEEKPQGKRGNTKLKAIMEEKNTLKLGVNYFKPKNK